MAGQIDLSKGAFSNQAAKGVVANRFEILAGELAAKRRSVREETGTMERRPRHTLGVLGTSEQAEDLSERFVFS